jgi:hypothetical protein
MGNWDTAGNILNDVAVELGLIPDDVADPVTSADANMIRLRRILKGVGQDLVREHDWTPLNIQYVIAITTSPGIAGYGLPDGFKKVVSPVWNTTTNTLYNGPLSAEQWQELYAGNSAAAPTPAWRADLAFRVFDGVAGNLEFLYASRFWVDDTGQADLVKEAPDNGADVVYLDRRLLVTGTKLGWLRATGMPSDGAADEFDRALANAKANDAAGQPLSLSGASTFQWPLRYNTAYGWGT